MPKALLMVMGVLLLTVTACSQPAERYVRVAPRPEMRFAMSPATGGAPLYVEFTNLAQDGEAFLWDFGDGTTSKEMEASHTYTQPGVYTVQLTVFRGEGENPKPVTSTQTLVVYLGSLTKVTIEPAEITLGPTEVGRLNARAFDQFGNEMPDLDLKWSVSGEGVIDRNGNVMAGNKTGSFVDAIKVDATLGGSTQSATATLNVEPGPLGRIVLEPSVAELKIEGPYHFEAKAFDQYGNEIPDATFEWSIPTTIGQFDHSGVFTAGSTAGRFTAELRATYREVSKGAQATLVIHPGPLDRLTIMPETARIEAGSAQQFTPIALDRYGNMITDVFYTWALSGPVGVVSPEGELKATPLAGPGGVVKVKGIRTGIVKEAEATVIVVPGPLTELSVHPKSTEVAIEGKVRFSIETQDRYGNPVGDPTILYSLPAGSGNSVIYPSGLLVAGTNSSNLDVAVTAIHGDVVKTFIAEVIVLPDPLDRVELLPREMTLAVTEQRDFKVKALDKYGNEIPVVEVDWAVVNEGGTIDQKGLFAAGTESGTFLDTVRVTVTNRGVTRQRSATVIVEPGTVARAFTAQGDY